VEKWLDTHPEKEYDIYFCPLPFKETTKRKKDTVRGSKLLWSDLDNVTPEQIQKLEPTLLWESSPGSFQGLWALSDVELSPTGAEELNKKLTYFIGGDTSGWDLTQVLRVPGTINHKYEELPRVSPFKQGKTYTQTEIENKLKDVVVDSKKIKLGTKVNIDGWDRLDPEGVYKKYENLMNLTTRGLIKASPGLITTGHRSDNLWKMYMSLIEIGLGPQEIVCLAQASRWNKWKGQKSESESFSREMTNAYESAGVEPKQVKVEGYDYTPIEVESRKPAKPRLDVSATEESNPKDVIHLGKMDVSPDIIDMDGEDFTGAIPDTYKQTLKLDMKYPDTNFVKKYVNHAKKLSDSYPEFHHGAVVSLLSIAIGRKAAMMFGSGTVFPNTWCFLLGSSTISRKSTAVGHAKDIANDLFGMISLPQSFSPESFIEVLSNTPQGWLFKDEVASLLAAMKKNYMGEIRDIFCEVYDNKGFTRKLRSSNKKVATEFNIQDPYVVQYVATTPNSLSENSQALDLTSGWLLRFMYYYPTYSKEWRPLQEMTKEQSLELVKIKQELKELGEFFWGLNTPLIFSFSKEADDYFVEWQRHEETSMARRNEEIESGAYGRLSVYAVKLAMIYHVGAEGFLHRAKTAQTKKEKMLITLEEITWACEEIENYFMPTVKQVYELVAMTDGRNNQKKIIHLLNSHDGYMSRANLVRKLRCKLRDFNDDIASLTESGEIEEKSIKIKGKMEIVYVKVRESVE
jgi:3D (Asp-Asp-Asp) domain-containing protein